MKKQKAPTYEEFYLEVKRLFQIRWPQLSDEEVESYLNESSFIRSMYDREKAEYEAGKSTYRQFMEGCASAVAYDLEMSY